MGTDFLEAPCSGSKAGAESATLTFMIGGEPAVYERVKPYLEAMGKQLYYCGGAERDGEREGADGAGAELYAELQREMAGEGHGAHAGVRGGAQRAGSGDGAVPGDAARGDCRGLWRRGHHWLGARAGEDGGGRGYSEGAKGLTPIYADDTDLHGPVEVQMRGPT